MIFSYKDTDEDLEKIREWLDCKGDIASRRMERKLSDFIEYGETISIFGKDDKAYTLSFDELIETPEASSEEQIEISLLSGNATLARGCAKLTIGYQNFDEDGGVSDGLDDNVEYEVDDVLDALKGLIVELKEEFNKEQKLVNDLEKCLNQEADN